MKTTSRSLSLGSALLFFLCAACGGDDSTGSVTVTPGGGDEARFGDGNIVVVDAQGDDYVVEGEPGDGCVQVGSDCVDLGGARGRYCDDPDAVIDVVIVDGEVVGGICYPAPPEGEPDVLEPNEEGDYAIPRNRNGGVLTFPEDSDGVVLKGDVILEGQRTTLYGNGIGRTVIDGDILIRANNARIRGVTVLGNVTVDNASNNVGLSFLEIHGSLFVNSNNSTILNTRVFGNVEITGNDAQFLSCRVAGDFTKSGSGGACDGSRYIDLVENGEEAPDDEDEQANGEENEDAPSWTTPEYTLGDAIEC